MKNYVFKLLIDGQLVGEGYGSGHSAMEAFENGVESGSIFFNDGQEIEVLALSDKGLGLRFKAVKGL